MGSHTQQFSLAEIESIGRPGIAVAGELDEATCGQLDSAFRDMPNGGGSVILDLGDCTFVDSKALDVIVRAATRLWDEGGQLLVCNARGSVRELFRITGLTTWGGLVLHRDVPA
jgi:anti-anti-sigma factor